MTIVLRRFMTDWLRAAVPMLVVGLFVVVTFLAGAALTAQREFAVSDDEARVTDVEPRRDVGFYPAPGELGAAGFYPAPGELGAGEDALTKLVGTMPAPSAP